MSVSGARREPNLGSGGVLASVAAVQERRCELCLCGLGVVGGEALFLSFLSL